MPDIRIINLDLAEGYGFDVAQYLTGAIDETQELVTSVIVALASDRRALDTDVLPGLNDTDKRGWWGDYQADSIWGGWPIGSRLWLLARSKIVSSKAKSGATTTRIKLYIREALQPFVTIKAISSFAVNVQQVDAETISTTITLYRGAQQTIELRFQSLWQELGFN